jgi:hypothetical protein
MHRTSILAIAVTTIALAGCSGGPTASAPDAGPEASNVEEPPIPEGPYPTGSQCSMSRTGMWSCLSPEAGCGAPSAIQVVCAPDAGTGASCDGADIDFLVTRILDAGVDGSYAAGCTLTFPACINDGIPSCACGGKTAFEDGWSCSYL